MANQTNLVRIIALGSAVMVVSYLRSPSEAQQPFQGGDPLRSESSFGTPPSLEKLPPRVGNRQHSTSMSGTSSHTADSDREWLPKMPRAAPSSPIQPQNSRNAEVQQASFTTHTIQSASTITPAGPSTSAAAALPQSDRQLDHSSIPLKPPSKNAKDLVPTKSQSIWSSAVSMVVSLLLVIGIFLGLSWIFRKTSPTAGNMLPKEVVEIVGRTPMANRQQLYVIRFGRKLVLVSQQVGQTEVLSEIDDRTEVDHLLGLCEQTSSRNIASSFRNVLQQVATSTDSRWSLRQRRDATRPAARSKSTSIDTLS